MNSSSLCGNSEGQERSRAVLKAGVEGVVVWAGWLGLLATCVLKEQSEVVVSLDFEIQKLGP